MKNGWKASCQNGQTDSRYNQVITLENHPGHQPSSVVLPVFPLPFPFSGQIITIPAHTVVEGSEGRWRKEIQLWELAGQKLRDPTMRYTFNRMVRN